jgi:hypothetical protein
LGWRDPDWACYLDQMPVNARVLFDTPQLELAPTLMDHYRRCRAAWIVTGFATVAGIETIMPELRRHPSKLEAFIVGAATFQAFNAIDSLIGSGVQDAKIFVHLGHARPKGNDPAKFWGYHPMMHSKVYLFDMGDDMSAAIVGSHNSTKFALCGLNSEAAVLLTGPTNEAEMQKLYAHVQACRNDAVAYDPSLKSGFAWWASQYFDDLRFESIDGAKDAEGTQTVVMLMARPSTRLPEPGETIYFELPLALQQTIKRTHTEVHIIFFSKPPANAREALADARSSVAALKCSVYQIDDKGRTRELQTEWFIPSRARPMMTPAPPTFRPNPAGDMQQVTAEVLEPLKYTYQYLFETDKALWIPDYDRTKSIKAGAATEVHIDDGDAAEDHERKTSREDHPEWFLVRGLRRFEPTESTEMKAALLDSSPESESFVLFSVRRRRLERLRSK